MNYTLIKKYLDKKKSKLLKATILKKESKYSNKIIDVVSLFLVSQCSD